MKRETSAMVMPIVGWRRCLAVALPPICVLVASSSAAMAAFPGLNGRIAFQGYLEGGSQDDIFTVLPDGSGLLQLTNTAVSEDDPFWSSDGRRLVFGRAGEVLMMNADGSGETSLAPSSGPGTLATPSFSPNGKNVVYATGSKLREVTTTGHRRSTILNHGGFVWPRFSPDGKRIVFAGIPDGETREGLWVIRKDGTHLRRLTDPMRFSHSAEDESPDFSPDGEFIIFRRSGKRGAVFRMRADGTRERRVIRTLEFPTYAPSGDLIAGTWRDLVNPDAFCRDLYTINPGGTGRMPLTANCAQWEQPEIGGSARATSWQPLPAGS